MRIRLCGTALVAAALALPITSLADITGSPTLSSGSTLDFDTGATATSGGSIQWTGNGIAVQAGTGWTPLAVAGVGGGAARYDALTEANLAQIPAYVPGGGPAGNIPSGFLVAGNDIIGFKTAAGHYAKMLVTSMGGGSLGIRFTTYGATSGGGGGGGGGANAPSISDVRNNYGEIPAGLPNYGIAPGTIFYIKGSNLSSVTTALLSSASPGLQTTVSGVTVSVTVNGTTVQCPIYYLLPTQIAAILPETTPLGTGTITVTNNGAASQGGTILVVQSAFGILSYNGSLAAAYDANNNIITSSNSANPNQAIVLWGSGVGADLSNDDKLFPQKSNNLTSIPMQAFVGGVSAAIAYRGRSQFPGLDQVVITIPAGVPTGCYVSVAIVSGSIVSNSATIPIAASGRTCSDNGTNFPPDVIQSLSGKTVKSGNLSVSQTTTFTGGVTRTDNGVFGSFQTISNFTSTIVSNNVSIGSCLVYYASTGTATANIGPLDAGTSITVTGPGGVLTMSQLSAPGISLGTLYAPPNGQAPSGFVPASGGSFTFDNGAGGPGVGHFNTTLNYPAALTWTNQVQITAVNRAQGVTVTWSGGAAGTFATITGNSTATVAGKIVSVAFTCQAPISAGQFTVPVPVLLALPSGNGSLAVGNSSNFVLFAAPGLDFGILSGSSTSSKSLTYN